MNRFDPVPWLLFEGIENVLLTCALPAIRGKIEHARFADKRIGLVSFGIDDRTQVDGIAPLAVAELAVPEIGPPVASRPVGSKIKPPSIR